MIRSGWYVLKKVSFCWTLLDSINEKMVFNTNVKTSGFSKAPWTFSIWLRELRTNGCLSRITRTMHIDYLWHTSALVVSQCVRESRVKELCVRSTCYPELQLVMVVGKISGFRNYLRTALYTERRGILSSFLNKYSFSSRFKLNLNVFVN